MIDHYEHLINPEIRTQDGIREDAILRALVTAGQIPMFRAAKEFEIALAKDGYRVCESTPKEEGK